MLISFGETVLDVYPAHRTLGGAPLNLAAHAALLGEEVLFLSSVGKDPYGEEALAGIRALGLPTGGIAVHPILPSGCCTVTLSPEGIPRYALAAHSAYDEIPLPDSLPASCRVLAFGTLALRYQKNRETLTRLLRLCQCREVYADLNIRVPYADREAIVFCLLNATTVKMSEEDMAYVSAVLSLPAGEENAIATLASTYPGIRRILLTRGEAGSRCYDLAEGEVTDCPAVPTVAVSTVGAGDSYGAAFLVAKGRGADTALAMQIAARVSSFVVAHREAIPEGMRRFLATLPPLPKETAD